MRIKLRLKHLQKAAKTTLDDKKSIIALQKEAKEVFGQTFLLSNKLSGLVETINSHLDNLDRTGRSVKFNDSTLLKLAEHHNSGLRKIVARTLSERFVKKFINDKNSEVRCAAAKRLPLKIIKEMVACYPSDDQLTVIYENRTRLVEEFDMYGEEPLGEDGKTYVDDDSLSDEWYVTKAKNIYDDYRGSSVIDVQWQATAVNSFCNHMKASSLIDIDRQKLLDCVNDIDEAVDDDHAARSAPPPGKLKESLLRSMSDGLRKSILTESNEMPPLFIPVDETKRLIENKTYDSVYVKSAVELFNIKMKPVSDKIKTRYIGDGIVFSDTPATGVIPECKTSRLNTERALDTFVSSWNTMQKQVASPVRIDWSDDGEQIKFITTTN